MASLILVPGSWVPRYWPALARAGCEPRWTDRHRVTSASLFCAAGAERKATVAWLRATPGHFGDHVRPAWDRARDAHAPQPALSDHVCPLPAMAWCW